MMKFTLFLFLLYNYQWSPVAVANDGSIVLKRSHSNFTNKEGKKIIEINNLQTADPMSKVHWSAYDSSDANSDIGQMIRGRNADNSWVYGFIGKNDRPHGKLRISKTKNLKNKDITIFDFVMDVGPSYKVINYSSGLYVVYKGTEATKDSKLMTIYRSGLSDLKIIVSPGKIFEPWPTIFLQEILNSEELSNASNFEKLIKMLNPPDTSKCPCEEYK